MINLLTKKIINKLKNTLKKIFYQTFLKGLYQFYYTYVLLGGI